MYLVFPALRISSRAGIDSVRGVSVENQQLKPQRWIIRHTRINAVQIVQIRSKAESLNSALNILLNMRSGVGD
jgi:hypothetical protein